MNPRDRLTNEARRVAAAVHSAISKHRIDPYTDGERAEAMFDVAAALDWPKDELIRDARSAITGEGSASAIDDLAARMTEFEQAAPLCNLNALVRPASALEKAVRRLATFPVSGATAGAAKPKSANRHKNVNGRMLAHMLADPGCRGWDSTEWATFLKCSPPAVTKTKAWAELRDYRESLKAEHANDRRHRAKGSDQRRAAGHD